MAITLLVNPGSSSKKYALYKEEQLIYSAHVEHDEAGVTLCLSVNGTADRCVSISSAAYQTSLLDFIERALSEKVIDSATDITQVGVRVVAPGTYFAEHRIVDGEYMHALKRSATKAPLHIPHTERELSVVRQALPHARIVAVSDSAFHRMMPKIAREYSIPPSVAKVHDIYRYGYHGISIAAVCDTVRRQLGKLPERVVVCHIGSGVSVTAVKAGRSIDTTMGYAPGSGLVMGSRAGDIDAGAMLALMEERKLRPVDAELYLQTEGGLKGLAGESDLRTILNRRTQGDVEASNAFDHFVYGLTKAIAGMAIALGGIDTLVFTATAGERSPVLRKRVLGALAPLGIEVDDEKNERCVSRDGEITGTKSSARVLVVKTDEARAMLLVCNEVSA